MTQNQIAWHNYEEAKRHNVEQERIAQETLEESRRHNMVGETQASLNYFEVMRGNNLNYRSRYGKCGRVIST